ncbi:MAG: hypothetical protein PHF50_00545 [Patescibacteria group bacterium]|nr:hypothetical protein [Patescibacteria group bacterium]
MSRKAKKKGVEKKESHENKSRPWKNWGNFEDHHLISEKRGGGKNSGNLKRFNGIIHWCFHQLFGNLTPSEAILFLQILLLGKKMKWRIREIRAAHQMIIDGKIELTMQFGGLSYTPSIEPAHRQTKGGVNMNTNKSKVFQIQPNRRRYG